MEIEKLEMCVREQKYEMLKKVLHEKFRSVLTEASMNNTNAPRKVNLRNVHEKFYYTRLCAVVIAAWMQDAYTVTTLDFTVGIKNAPMISMLIEVTGFQHPDYLYRYFLKRYERLKKRQAPKEQILSALYKAFFCYSLSSSESLPEIDGVFVRVDEIVLVIAALLSGAYFFSETRLNNRQKLMEYLDNIQKLPHSDAILPAMTHTSFYAGYEFSMRKNQIFRACHRLTRQWLIEKDATKNFNRYEISIAQKRTVRERPIIWVAAGNLLHNRASYRALYHFVVSLSEQFDMIGFYLQGDDFSGETDAFSKLYPVRYDGSRDLHTICRQIRQLNPDIIYYPSLGMEHWAYQLAKLRLAPIQLMTTGLMLGSGGPDIMDYVVLREETYSPKAIFDERVLVLPKGTGVFEMVKPELSVQANPQLVQLGAVKIAIFASAMKFNPRFIHVLQTIQKNSRVRMRYVFMQSTTDLGAVYTEEIMFSLFGNPIVFPYEDFERYLSNLAACDICLQSFPFGGTNTTVDAFRCGLPLVTMEGTDTQEKVDAVFIRKLGLSERWIAHSDEEYIAEALRLIEDEAYRESERAKVCGIQDKLKAWCKLESVKPDFGEMMLQVYHHHEAIMASDKRVFRRADLDAFSAHAES